RTKQFRGTQVSTRALHARDRGHGNAPVRSPELVALGCGEVLGKNALEDRFRILDVEVVAQVRGHLLARAPGDRHLKGDQPGVLEMLVALARLVGWLNRPK